MISKQSLVYSRSSVARILGVDAKLIKDFRVWDKVCFVVVSGKRATFLSKRALKEEFARFRQASGKALFEAGQVSDRVGRTYAVASSRGDAFYQVEVKRTGLECQCEDHKNQVKHFGKGVCKHGYSVISALGLNSLSEYLAAAELAQRQARQARISKREHRETAHHYRAMAA